MCEKGEIIPNTGNLINIFPEVGPQYKLAFDLWIEEFPECCKYVTSVVKAVPEDEKISIPSIYESPEFPKQKWIHFEVTQKADVLGLHLFKISIDEVTYTISNPDPKVYEKVKLYAGSPDHSAIQGKIKNLSFVQFD